ncbi:MAG: copper amine oxidase N-terminal domain-containing protein [Firmicutes bacterium]|nr:copper amine oxidase N-terminal domain-containing protein [Bacillota bacterium]
MKGWKKGLAVLLLAAVFVFASAAAAGAQEGSKYKKLDYNNFKINVNGKLVNLSAKNQPFAIDGVTYVPLRVVGQALNSNVAWRGETKTVVITSGSSVQVTTLLQQIAQKDAEIHTLKQEVARLQNKAREEEEDDLSQLEEDLWDDYDEIEDVEVDDIWLDGDREEVDVEIEVDLDDYGRDWKDLSDNDIKVWVSALVGDIQDELSDNTEVNGEIINSDNNDLLVKFSKDGKKRISMQYRDGDYRGEDVEEVEDQLDGDSYYIEGIEFEITSIYYDEDDDDITVSMRAQEDDTAATWDDLDRRDIEDDVEDICEDIAETFEDDANVEPDYVYITLRDEDNERLEEYEYDVDDESLD